MRWLSAIVISIGFLGMLGWLFDSAILTQYVPGTVTMKLTTSFCMFLLGCTLWPTEDKGRLEWLQLSAGGLILFIMTEVTMSALSHQPNYFEHLFDVNDTLVNTIYPGQPSRATMFLFFWTASYGILYNIHKTYWAMGIPVTCLATMALVGHWVGSPVLYFYTPESTGMAIPTALGFLFSSLAIYFRHVPWKARQIEAV